MEEKSNNRENSGRKYNQKMKPYLILQYLLKHTDKNNVRSATQLIEYLEDKCGISAERRSVCKDIKEINIAMYINEFGGNVAEAEQAIANGDFEFIVYNKQKRGFFISEKHVDIDDMHLLAQCVYSAKFLSKDKANKLIDVICDFVSEYEAETIRQDSLLTDRIRVNNNRALYNISTINTAMSKSKDHIPQKIGFKYLTSAISGNTNKQIERKKSYIVSPFKLLINESNYYLIAFEQASGKIKTYRVDRMKDVVLLDEAREGEESFSALDIQTYPQRTFSMFGGKTERVTIRFINPLLDTVVERFGSSARYLNEDENHFTINAEICISKQFFSWVCGFGKGAKIVSPSAVVDEFKGYLKDISGMYE